MTTKAYNEPSPTPFHVLAKPIGPICNLDCEYCFYLKKQELFPESKSFRMNEEALEAFTRGYIECQPQGVREVNFAWQGGEPTMLGVKFFQRAIELQEQYIRPGTTILNSIQTNGTLLDDEWGEFLHENKFLVGISIDGPEEIHDEYRLDKQGQGSFGEVMRGLDVLKRHKVEFNTLTVVQNRNSQHGKGIYDFLKSIGSTFFQFIPIVEPDPEAPENALRARVSSRSVDPEQYGRFLCDVMDRWLELEDVGEVFVRDFDTSLALVVGRPSPICVNAETCGRAVAIEHNGDLFSCDHFVNDKDRIGNVLEESFDSMLDGLQQTEFGDDKRDGLPPYCRECDFLGLCNGGCPKDRIIQTPEGDSGLNYLCAGYKIFHEHSLPVFQKMAQCLSMQRPASDYAVIDDVLREQAAAHAREAMGADGKAKSVGPNEPCPCGSGRKFKKCCLARV